MSEIFDCALIERIEADLRAGRLSAPRFFHYPERPPEGYPGEGYMAVYGAAHGGGGRICCAEAGCCADINVVPADAVVLAALEQGWRRVDKTGWGFLGEWYCPKHAEDAA